MEPYVYQEYPKCLYLKSGQTIDVQNEEQEQAMAKEGYMTAEQYYAPSEEPTQPESKKKSK